MDHGALHESVAAGDAEALRQYLQGSQIALDAPLLDADHEDTLLTCAARSDNKEAIRLLLRAGASADRASGNEGRPCTAHRMQARP